MYYVMTRKKLSLAPLDDDRIFMIQEKWEYLEDPTYQLSLGNMVCMTCNKFSFTNHATCGSLLYCNYHKKLIFHGDHLTHSCEIYNKKESFGIEKKLIKKTKVG